MKAVKIVDAPCGYGKTQWAIQHMNEIEDHRFIFITPYLDEVKRIACLHDFYLSLAKQATPVIEVGAAKKITVVISEGKELEIRETEGAPL